MLDTLVAAVTPELADAVAISLGLEASERYRTAREMGRALHDAALGVPPVAPAAGAGTESATQQTSVLSRAGRSARSATQRSGASPEPVVPRRPRAGPPRQRQVPEPVAARRRGRRGRRLFVAVVAILALAGVIAAIVAISAPAPTKVVLRKVVYSDVRQASEALSQLVAENTK